MSDRESDGAAHKKPAQNCAGGHIGFEAIDVVYFRKTTTFSDEDEAMNSEFRITLFSETLFAFRLRKH